MYVLIAGGGKVGSNLTRSLLRAGHELTLIEQRPYRYEKLEAEFEHQVLRGDATELFVLERAGIRRPLDPGALEREELGRVALVHLVLELGLEHLEARAALLDQRHLVPGADQRPRQVRAHLAAACDEDVHARPSGGLLRRRGPRR